MGGEFIIMPALRKATNARTNNGDSVAVVTLASGFGVISTAIAERMNWQIGVPFAAGAMIGMLGGRLIGSRSSGHRLQQAFALVLGLVAIDRVD
ncbi:TSUP family transporter [Caballeronia glebae]|uniref:TSUP family transporter n=1 Tax=Caballeronia glebae TaxID=1777143 RepID=UPI0038B76F52